MQEMKISKHREKGASAGARFAALAAALALVPAAETFAEGQPAGVSIFGDYAYDGATLTLKDGATATVGEGAEWTLAHVVFASGTNNSFVVESGAKLTLTLGKTAVFADNGMGDNGMGTGGSVKIANASDLTFSLSESVVPAGAGTVTVGLFSWSEDADAATPDVVEIVVGGKTLTNADETALNTAFDVVSFSGNGADRIASKVFKKNVNSTARTTIIYAALTFIPEPSAFGLSAGAAALAFAAMRRRRRK